MCTVMPSVEADSTASLQFLPGQADSYGSSIILKVEGRANGLRSRGEYVFGVGENFSRAVLEHKIRPSSNLRATFSSTLGSTQIGGLGGLILRLRSDGHQQVQRRSVPLAMLHRFVVMLLRRSMLGCAHARTLELMDLHHVCSPATLAVRPTDRARRCLCHCTVAQVRGSVQVACVGPTGTISHARALRHIFGWRYPTVNVLEFSDMDSGDVAYSDNLLQVYALTNPAIDWVPPVLKSAGADRVASGTNVHAVDTDHVAPRQADGMAPAEGTAAASLHGSVRQRYKQQEEHLAMAQGGRVQTAAVSATPSTSDGSSSAGDGVSSDTSAEKAAADTTSEDCSSSDDSDESASQASQGVRFAAVDALFRSGAPSADVFSALRPPKRSWQQTSDAASQAAASKRCNNAAPRPRSGGGAQAALAAVPARPAAKAARRTDAAAAHSSASAAAAFTSVPGLRVSGRDVPVVAVRDASGSIGKVARGAAAFLVHVKPRDVWLLVSCPCEVRNAFAPACLMVHLTWLADRSSSRTRGTSHWHYTGRSMPAVRLDPCGLQNMARRYCRASKCAG